MIIIVCNVASFQFLYYLSKRCTNLWIKNKFIKILFILSYFLPVLLNSIFFCLFVFSMHVLFLLGFFFLLLIVLQPFLGLGLEIAVCRYILFL